MRASRIIILLGDLGMTYTFKVKKRKRGPRHSKKNF